MKQRFTLIEVLVVVAIIGILASLLLPSLGKARSRAKRITCASQQKQLGIALYNYTDDNDQYMPVHLASHYTWDDYIAGYDGRASIPEAQKPTSYTSITDDQNKLYLCPEDTTTPLNGYTKKSYGITVWNPTWSDCLEGISGGWTNGPMSRSISSIGSTGDTILLAERLDNKNVMGYKEGYVSHIVQNGIVDTNSSPIPHNDKFNYLFVDGHVELMTFYQTLNGQTYVWSNSLDTKWDASR